MRSVFYPQLLNGPFGDPALYVRLAHHGEALLFDCGDLSSLSARAILKVSRVFLSHAHIDHLIGFDTLLRQLLYREQPLYLYGPEGTIDRLASRLNSYTWNLVEGYPFNLTVQEWTPRGHPRALFRAGTGFRREDLPPLDNPDGLLCSTPNYTVRAAPLSHGDIISLAFALEETRHVAIHKDALQREGYRQGAWLTAFKDILRRDPLSYELMAIPLENGEIRTLPAKDLAAEIAHLERGMKITYVTDASPTAENEEQIVKLAAESHLLAIEATFSHSELERALQRNHLTARLAGELGRRCEAKRLLVFHHSPRYHEHPLLLEQEAQQAFEKEADGA